MQIRGRNKQAKLTRLIWRSIDQREREVFVQAAKADTDRKWFNSEYMEAIAKRRSELEDLNSAKQIRNAFAHTGEFIDFSSPEVLKYLKTFSCFSNAVKVSEYQMFFVTELSKIDKHLDAVIAQSAIAPGLGN